MLLQPLTLPVKPRYPQSTRYSRFQFQASRSLFSFLPQTENKILFHKTKIMLYIPLFISTTTKGTNTSKPRPEMSDVSRRTIPTIRIHIMALDGIVNVNSLFSIALFIGLTWYPTTDVNSMLLASDTACAAGADAAEGLISFHVYSFSSFLFSSLIALALKQAIKISTSGDGGNGGSDSELFGANMGHVNRVGLRVGTLVSAFGSVFGCGFLMMALVDLVQIKLGRLSCGDLHTFAAIGPLVTLVPSALVVYVFLVLHAFTR